MRSATSVAAAAAGLVVAGVLAGCGGGGSAVPQAGTPADARPDDLLQSLVNRGGAGAPVLDCSGLAGPVRGAPAAVGKGGKLPGLTFECLGGGAPVTLSELRGPMVLNVWASWCLPCADEIPYLSEVHEALGQKVRFAAVALTDQDPDSKAWLSFHGVDWPSLADPKGSVRGPMKVPGPPVTFFVNSAGTITEVHYGAFTSARQVQDAIAEHLGVT